MTEVMVNGPDDVYVEREGRFARGGLHRHEDRRWACASLPVRLSVTKGSRAPA